MTDKIIGPNTFAAMTYTGRTFADMIAEGWLTPVNFYAPEVPLTSSLWPEAITQYRRHAAGKKALVFCAGQQQVAEALAHFLDAGIAATSLTADDGPAKRTANLKGFASGAYQVLIGVTLTLDLGNDPSVEVVIMVAPTRSKTRFEVMVASAMRPQFAEGMTPAEADYRRATIASGGKPRAIVLDFAGNCQRVGLESFNRRSPKPATHLTIPGSLEWDQTPESSAPLERSEGGAGENASSPQIRLDQVLTAYIYADEHPHKYLRGTTNWCAAVAHSLNTQVTKAASVEIETLRKQLALLNPARTEHCKECGSLALSWFATNTTGTSGIQNGRLKTEDVTCQFVLGCDNCSETLRVVNADTVAARLNADTQHAKDNGQ